MNTFTQHIPGFIDVGDVPPPAYEFATTADLLRLDVVQRYGNSRDFLYFAMSDNRLMEISADSWWVVGYIADPAAIDLPIWHAPRVSTWRA